jgi:formylglycine-generating enzyme required for sulfatase activity
MRFFPRLRLSATALGASAALQIALAAGPEATGEPPAYRSEMVGVVSRGVQDGLHRNMVLIPAGDYTPLIRSKDEPERVRVAEFWLDERAVTNREFLEFVRAHPQWRRSAVSPLFADTEYLSDWAGDLELGSRAPANAPVVRVSWFAARAFARAHGKRLPTTAEWERAASAGFSSANGAAEPGFTASVLAWFARPSPTTLPDAGTGRANFHGARDLFGLVWEWVDDFNTSMVTGESRADTGLERDLFCGAGAAGARNPSDYAAFMRAGFRSSLRANYAVPNLGFRCAADVAPAISSSR